MLRAWPLLLAVSCLVLAWQRGAWGAEVDVSPVRVHLSEKRRTESIALHNRGAEKVRYQVTDHAWEQATDGTMKLTDTEELVVFPSLLEIDPGQTKRIKISTVAKAGAVEKSYRIFLEELPIGAGRPGEVRVLTRFGIPVFLQPRAPKPKPALEVRVEKGRLIVALTNTGTSYFIAKSVRAVGRAQDGRILFEEKLPGWYVLAKGERRYEVALTPAICAALASLTGEVETEDVKTEAKRSVEAQSCGP